MPMPSAKGEVDKKLDTFTADYMRVMNAPGMTQALTDTKTTIRTASYGFANVDLKTPVTTDHLFQIGSITKSFAALILLQLRDEGKLDLHRPVLEYLPWLPVTMPYGPITAHHLLTHTSGLPDASAIFQSDPGARHAQGFEPGSHFHYCNLGFAILGQIVEHLDGRPWYQCLQARILMPLGMTSTAAVITIESSARSATAISHSLMTRFTHARAGWSRDRRRSLLTRQAALPHSPVIWPAICARCSTAGRDQVDASYPRRALR